MIIKNNLFKFSSLCIAGAISILVNQATLNTNANQYNVADSQSGMGIASGYTYDNENGDKSLDSTNLITGDTISNSTGASVDTDEKDKDSVKDNDVPADDVPEATPEPTKDPNEVPGIDYKKYIDYSKYKNLGIVNVTTYLNVREGAGTSTKIIAKMPPHAGCTILETVKDSEGNVWCKIKSGDVTGYVLQEYLITGDEATALIPSAGRLVIKVDTDVLNVRTKPSTNADILYQIAKGETLDVASATADWIEVNVDIGSSTGYVAREYVKITFELKTAIDVDEMLVGVSTERTQIVAYAKQFLGNPYVYGGTNLYKGIDCSAYVRAIYKQFGYSLHRTSREQAASDGVKITEAQLQPGDLVFYATKGTVTHVAMYIGNGKIIHASNPRDGIKISNMKYATPYRYKKILSN